MPAEGFRSRSPARFVKKRTQFILASFFYAALCPPLLAACVSTTYDQIVSVDHVHDGDTVKLNNGRSLRLIAINTPEVARKQRPAEPLAGQARAFVQAALRTKPQLRLRFDEERQDRHGRLLAHAFLPDGRNLGEALILAGLAAHIAVPPNLWGIDCYQRAEQFARKKNRGLWKHPYFKPKHAATLDPALRGFHFVQGRIERIGKSRSAIWLNLDPGFAIRVPRKDLANFTTFKPQSLLQKSVTVRGWIYTSKKQLRLNLRHPAGLEMQTMPATTDNKHL